MSKPAALADRTALAAGPPSPPATDGLRARAILSPNDKEVLTLVRTTDMRTALARGLKEYLEPLSVVWEGGRRLAFKKALVVWAEPEDPAEYPSLVLVAQQEMAYEATQLTPTLVQSADGTQRFLRQVAEGHQELQLIIWTNDPAARMGLVAAVEDALDPAEFMTGLRLELPYYFGARASYEKLSLLYDDSQGDAQRRYRRAVLRVNANIPQLVPVGPLPSMRVQTELDVSDSLSLVQPGATAP